MTAPPTSNGLPAPLLPAAEPKLPQELTTSYNRFELFVAGGNVGFHILFVSFLLSTFIPRIGLTVFLAGVIVAVASMIAGRHLRKQWLAFWDRWSQYAKSYEFPCTYELDAQEGLPTINCFNLGVHIHFEAPDGSGQRFIKIGDVEWRTGPRTYLRFPSAHYDPTGGATARLHLERAIITTPTVPKLTRQSDSGFTLGFPGPPTQN